MHRRHLSKAIVAEILAQHIDADIGSVPISSQSTYFYQNSLIRLFRVYMIDYTQDQCICFKKGVINKAPDMSSFQSMRTFVRGTARIFLYLPFFVSR